jgi:hypothetical protein
MRAFSTTGQAYILGLADIDKMTAVPFLRAYITISAEPVIESRSEATPGTG